MYEGPWCKLERLGWPRLAQPLNLCWPSDRHVQVHHQAVGQGIDPAVDAEVLTTRPGLVHQDVGCYIPHLSDDVEFTQPVEASAPVRDRVKRVAMLAVNLTDGVQPVIHETTSFAVHRRAHSATPVVPHHDNVLYL